jgi:hypothetical protein
MKKIAGEYFANVTEMKEQWKMEFKDPLTDTGYALHKNVKEMLQTRRNHSSFPWPEANVYQRGVVTKYWDLMWEISSLCLTVVAIAGLKIDPEKLNCFVRKDSQKQ